MNLRLIKKEYLSITFVYYIMAIVCPFEKVLQKEIMKYCIDVQIASRCAQDILYAMYHCMQLFHDFDLKI